MPPLLLEPAQAAASVRAQPPRSQLPAYPAPFLPSSGWRLTRRGCPRAVSVVRRTIRCRSHLRPRVEHCAQCIRAHAPPDDHGRPTVRRDSWYAAAGDHAPAPAADLRRCDVLGVLDAEAGSRWPFSARYTLEPRAASDGASPIVVTRPSPPAESPASPQVQDSAGGRRTLSRASR